MHPIMLNLPFGISVKSYGLMMMLGFFAATWWAMYRANKVKADPDVILNLGFISLICGIVGARLLYVIQYYRQDFAAQPNLLMAIIDITKGGLVFYGGFLLAVIGALIYLVYAKHSIRLYLDILAPSLMIGLAFGRMGCFLNGCCWGAPTERVPWAVSFPFGSPPYNEHWHRALADAPQQLLFSQQIHAEGLDVSAAIPMDRDHVNLPPDVLNGPQEKMAQLQQALDAAQKDKAGQQTIDNLVAEVKAARERLDQTRKQYFDAYLATERYGQTPSEIAAIASHHRSLPVHPTQLYAIIDAALLGLMLHTIFMRRRQQGMVFGLLFIFYGAGRFVEELIRGDNPMDSYIGPFAFTMSQMISIYTIAFAIVYLIVIYRLPAASPTAVRVVPAEPRAESPAK